MGRSRIVDHHLALLTCFPKGFLTGTNILTTMLPSPIVCVFIDMGILSLEQLSKAPRLQRGHGAPLPILLQLSIKFLLISPQHFLKLNLICSAVTYVGLTVLFTSQISLSVPCKHRHPE